MIKFATFFFFDSFSSQWGDLGGEHKCQYGTTLSEGNGH